jgi:hypothetical protein
MNQNNPLPLPAGSGTTIAKPGALVPVRRGGEVPLEAGILSMSARVGLRMTSRPAGFFFGLPAQQSAEELLRGAPPAWPVAHPRSNSLNKARSTWVRLPGRVVWPEMFGKLL